MSKMQRLKQILVLISILLGSLVNSVCAQTIQIIFQPQNLTMIGDIIQYDNLIDMPPVVFQKEFTLGYSAGFMFDIPLGKKTEINIGCLYSHQRQNFKDVNETGSLSYDSTIYVYDHSYSCSMSLDYLKFPIQFTFSSDTQKKFLFTCFGGFYFGALLDYTKQTHQVHKDYQVYNNQYSYWTSDQSSSTTGSSINLNSTYSQSPVNFNTAESYNLHGEAIKGFDFGFTTGAGIAIKISEKLSVLVLFTYEIGLVNIKNIESYYSLPYRPPAALDNNVSVWENFDTLKNSIIGLRVGLKLRI